MAVNIKALIQSLGKTYKEMMDAELIPYKTAPTGFSGDDVICLDMIKEGVFLSFYREGRIFKEMTLRMLNEKNEKYRFPNKLPSPLVPEMNRAWIHNKFGEPEKALPPRPRLNKYVGWTELYTVMDAHIPTSMQISYDLLERVKSITFLPTEKVRW
ncbi:Uncharacterised protein [Pragia fontium]|uniref:Pyocin immunity protein n=1 Tax=Pragia fontium TaxID=82985 RepID=A0ABQ5LIB2_9GAMM|nr:DUF6392 family protein [Pragia fontium]GKX63350.1 hypothetical protein SOASR032_19190 [Pragia fontium]SUB81360.1 Uncharacterised protein [Pragia fontium]